VGIYPPGLVISIRFIQPQGRDHLRRVTGGDTCKVPLTRSARGLVGVGLAVVLISSPPLGPVRPAVTASPGKSPSGKILIVTVNLMEGGGATGDLRNMREVKVFVNRLLRRIPFEPDVLLLQEVRRKSAREVARVMSRRTDHRFRAVIAPGKRPWRQTETKVIRRDTAVVINSRAMREVGEGGFLATSYPAKHGNAEVRRFGKRQVKESAYTLVKERASDTTLAVLSIHWPGNFRSKKYTNLYGKKWSEKSALFLQNEYASEDPQPINVIGGDFNRQSHRKLDNGDRTPYPFWKYLTGDPYHYLDAVWTVDARADNKDITNGGVDFIFARASILHAGIDQSYDWREASGDPDRFYSDHRFRWALVAPSGQ
jgi:hypothetical protein